jgi:hypothetical protein
MTEPQPRGADDTAQELDADATARELIVVTRRLAETLERESELLRAPRLAGLAALYAQKAELAKTYGKLNAVLRADPDRFRHVASDLRDALLSEAERLNRAAAVNERRLRAVGDATVRVIGFIAEAVTAQRASAGYTNSRKRAPLPSAAGVSLDKNF